MVYLIHARDKLHHAQHYIGYAECDVNKRLKRHRSGDGAKLLKAMNEAGIEYDVARVWEHGDRNFERKLKNRKNARALCPVCNGRL